jgi:hypothetical protein
MDPKEYYDFEDRRYVDPFLSRDEQLGFVDTLRNTVGRNTAQINTQTKALGSALPSTMGGLTGSNSYFTQRYQTMPIETQMQTLRATAQAKALNDLMTNYQNQIANRYRQAYRKSGGSNGNNSNKVQGDVDYVDEGYDEEVAPPNTKDYYKSAEEVRQNITKKTGLPDWLVNILTTFGIAG